MMSCLFEKQVVLFAYGELSGEERTDLEEHLRKCPSCGKFAEKMNDFVRVPSPGASLTAPVTLKERVLSNLERKKTLRGRSQTSAWARAALFLFLLAGFGVYRLPGIQHRRSTNPQGVAVAELDMINNIEILEDMDQLDELSVAENMDFLEAMDELSDEPGKTS